MKLSMIELPYVDSADLFDKVADQPWAMLLDSGVSDQRPAEHQPRLFDVLAIKPQSTLVFDGAVTHFRRGATRHRLYGDALEILKSAIPVADEVGGVDSPYLPGALGYFSYDLARQFEELPSLAADDENLPPLAMGVYDVVLVVDHQKRATLIVYLGEAEETLSKVAEWRDLVAWSADYVALGAEHSDDQAAVHPKFKGGLVCQGVSQNMNKEVYRKCFESVRDYTIEGDCYQVNLAQRFSTRADGDAWLTYRYLRQQSPAPYGAYFNLPFAHVLSNSPESFIQCRNRNVVTSPIKGTRPRVRHNSEIDQAVARSLENSDKDRAENLMIVDLMRNDLGRCCELGSVNVPKLFELHSFANVHHLISTVTGRLRVGVHALDLLRSCFPGGSITGAPKIRAMQIIEELEPHRRGLYCGAIGYIGVDGSLETNIAIRTIVVKDGVARYAAGGGLVIDSELDAEYQELADKASMMADALFSSNTR